MIIHKVTNAYRKMCEPAADFKDTEAISHGWQKVNCMKCIDAALTWTPGSQRKIILRRKCELEGRVFAPESSDEFWVRIKSLPKVDYPTGE